VQLLYALNEREIVVPIFADLGENGDTDALVGLGELASRNGDARGMQVYRARFGGGTRLQIEADLHRGASLE
jgi:hypothetical protein